MGKNKKVYVDSRYKTSGSVSNSDFKFEINEALDLPDNTYCYIDDICIPHTWYTIEDFNNTLYIVVKLYIHYGTTYAAPVTARYCAQSLDVCDHTGCFSLFASMTKHLIELHKHDSQVTWNSRTTYTDWCQHVKVACEGITLQ